MPIKKAIYSLIIFFLSLHISVAQGKRFPLKLFIDGKQKRIRGNGNFIKLNGSVIRLKRSVAMIDSSLINANKFSLELKDKKYRFYFDTLDNLKYSKMEIHIESMKYVTLESTKYFAPPGLKEPFKYRYYVCWGPDPAKLPRIDKTDIRPLNGFQTKYRYIK